MAKLALQTVFLTTALSIAAQAQISRERVEKTYTSPNGVQESCIAIGKLPQGNYKRGDVEEEQRLCNLDFYNNTVALCPKTWSTSPGTIIHDFAGHATSSEQAEASLCRTGNPMKTLSKFKQTMNQADTSATFSASSIMYYHFSRALDAIVTVPAAVYRSMDKDIHKTRVADRARPAANARMNIAGWNWLRRADANPSVYQPTSDLFTADRRQIYGVLLKNKGERYGAEINGTRASGWGDGQNHDFQKTPAFMALKSSLPLREAITAGYNSAIRDGAMARAFATGRPSEAQMVLWMNEVSEIVILDYIFSQQDRIGNIDYVWHWAYLDPASGEVKAEKVNDERLESLSRAQMNRITPPVDIADKNPVLVQKTSIGDNDAGGMVQYANFTRRTGMLEGLANRTPPLQHINAETYRRVLRLANDFRTRGPNYQTLDREIRILGYNDSRDRRFSQLINNTIRVAEILENNCVSGQLKLDLVSFKQAIKNEWVNHDNSCRVE